LARYVDPEKARGNLPEVAPMSEYVEVIPSVQLPSVDEAIRLHSQALDVAERRRPIVSAGFRSSRISRF
jgi:hypothetical protein